MNEEPTYGRTPTELKEDLKALIDYDTRCKMSLAEIGIGHIGQPMPDRCAEVVALVKNLKAENEALQANIEGREEVIRNLEHKIGRINAEFEGFKEGVRITAESLTRYIR